MSVVYRKSDRVKIQVGDIEIHVSPLSYHEKSEIQALLLSKDIDGMMKGGVLALQYAIKNVKGLTSPDGSEHQLEFDGGKLTDDALSDLMNLSCNSKISSICIALINGIPDEFIDVATNEVLEGVRIITKDLPEKKD
jgi:hypothetical protein